MNYFNYFTEVEDEFSRRRGKHSTVSPLDWILIETWKERGVPLHIVLRGINTSFDGYDKRLHRNRRVNSLFFCQQEVEAQFLEHLESRIGSNNNPALTKAAPAPQNGAAPTKAAPAPQNGATAPVAASAQQSSSAQQAEDNSPFGKKRVLDYLEDNCTTLGYLSRKYAATEPLAEVFQRAAARLQELIDEVRQSRANTAEGLETDLTLLEGVIVIGLRECAGAEMLREFQKEGHKQLRAYRDNMEREVYEQTHNNYVARRLRERFQTPRLSLFYLN